jgi:hypothetical protein
VSGWYHEGCALLDEAAAISHNDTEVLRLQIMRSSIDSDRAIGAGRVEEAMANREQAIDLIERFERAGGPRTEALGYRMTRLVHSRRLFASAGRSDRHAAMRDETERHIRSLLASPADAEAARDALLRLVTEVPKGTDDLAEVLPIAQQRAARTPRDPQAIAVLRFCHLRLGDEAAADAVWRAYVSTNPAYRVNRAGDEYVMLVTASVETGLLPRRMLPGS